MTFILALAGLIAFSMTASAQATGRGRKYKAPPPTAKITISVVRDTDSKPIGNAAVIFTLTTEKGNMELKTDFEGKAVIDVLPVGAGCRLQIISKGYQTYGEDLQIDKDEIVREIRMKRPSGQYSIYKDHPESDKAPEKGNSEPGKTEPK